MENTLFEDGACLQSLTDAHVAALRVAGAEAARRKAAMPPAKPEPNDASVIKNLVDQAMPSVKRAAKNLQRTHAENELQRRRDQTAQRLEAMAQPHEDF